MCSVARMHAETEDAEIQRCGEKCDEMQRMWRDAEMQGCGGRDEDFSLILLC